MPGLSIKVAYLNKSNLRVVLYFSFPGKDVYNSESHKSKCLVEIISSSTWVKCFLYGKICKRVIYIIVIEFFRFSISSQLTF